MLKPECCRVFEAQERLWSFARKILPRFIPSPIPVRQICSCMLGDRGGQQKSTPVPKVALRSLAIVLSLGEPAHFFEVICAQQGTTCEFHSDTSSNLWPWLIKNADA